MGRDLPDPNSGCFALVNGMRWPPRYRMAGHLAGLIRSYGHVGPPSSQPCSVMLLISMVCVSNDLGTRGSVAGALSNKCWSASKGHALGSRHAARVEINHPLSSKHDLGEVLDAQLCTDLWLLWSIILSTISWCIRFKAKYCGSCVSYSE